MDKRIQGALAIRVSVFTREIPNAQGHVLIKLPVVVFSS